jgi:hypothetical protein
MKDGNLGSDAKPVDPYNEVKERFAKSLKKCCEAAVGPGSSIGYSRGRRGRPPIGPKPSKAYVAGQKTGLAIHNTAVGVKNLGKGFVHGVKGIKQPPEGMK